MPAGEVARRRPDPIVRKTHGDRPPISTSDGVAAQMTNAIMVARPDDRSSLPMVLLWYVTKTVLEPASTCGTAGDAGPPRTPVTLGAPLARLSG